MMKHDRWFLSGFVISGILLVSWANGVQASDDSDKRGAGLHFQKNRVSLPKASQDHLKSHQSAVDLKKVKPPRTSSFMMEEADSDKAQLERITDQQIDELYKLTQQYMSSPQRGELWLRLAELYVEKASLIDYRRQTEYDKRLRDYQDGRTKEKPRLDLRDAMEYNRKAIQLYEWFARDFPRDEKMDQALFFLGYNNYEIGQIKKGTEFYTRLTRQFPRSPFILESHFALAEYYFENEQWKKALEHYKYITSRPRHRLANFSLYKTAWCYFRSGDSRKAMKTMEDLIRQNRRQAEKEAAGKKTVSRARLESEGLRDIVVFFADIGDPKKAVSYFQNLAGSSATSYLEKLAYLYSDKGNREGSRLVFNYLISKNPMAPKSFDYKYQVVRGYANASKTRQFREELYAWIRQFGADSAWYKANKDNVSLIEDSNKLRETTLRNWVLQQHQIAQNSKAKFAQALAMEGYKLYLQEFSQFPSVGDMHFYYGELLYDMERYDEAGAEYRWVFENAPKSKYFHRAAENIILALERDVPKDSEITKVVGKSLDPVPFNKRTERFVQASLSYLEKFPASEKIPEIKFRVGRLHYQHNHFDEAIPYFREIVKSYPRTKYAEYSANLLLDIYNLKKDYKGLEAIAQELLSLPSIAASPVAKDIRAVLERAHFKRAQDVEGQKDYLKSAEQFESFAKQNKDSALAVTARFNAGINYERAGHNKEAIINHTFVLQSKNKDATSLKIKSRRILAKLYQDGGMLEDAAVSYHAAAVEAGRDPIAANLFFNAAILNEALGRSKEAVQDYEAYGKLSKKSERVQIAFQIAELYRKSHQLSAAIDHYKEYVQGGTSREKAIESAYWTYQLSKELKRKKDADQWERKVLDLQAKAAPRKKGVGAGFAAKVKLEQALALVGEMKSVKIPAQPKAQKTAVQKKIGRLTQLTNQLSDVIKYDSGEEIVGALFTLGEANQYMGEALVLAPLPSGLNIEETKQYREGIQKLAEPFYKKAKDSLKTAVEKASELDVYNAYYWKARELLMKLDASALVDHGEIPLETRLGAWMGN